MLKSEEIKSQINDLRGKIAREKENLQIFLPFIENNRIHQKSLKEELKRIQEEYSRRIEEQNNMIREAAGAVWEAEQELKRMRDAIRQMEWDLEDLLRALARAEAEENAIQNLLDQTRQFDLITQDAVWRKMIKSYQVIGSKQMAAVKKGILGDKRGLGKTIQSVAYIDMLQAKRVLYIIPKKYAGNLRREVARWSPDRTIVHLPEYNRPLWSPLLKGIAKAPEFTVIINLEAWRKDPEILKSLKLLALDTVIVDEAHHINNHTTASYKGVKEIITAGNYCQSCDSTTTTEESRELDGIISCNLCGYFTQIERKEEFQSVKNVLFMTGSGIKNRPDDLWPLLNILDEDAYPKQKSFLRDFCVSLGGNKYGWAYGGEERLTRQMGMRYLSRTRETAGVEIPPQEIQYIEIDFDREAYPYQYAAYKEVEKDFILRLSTGEVMRMTEVIQRITRMRQILTWPNGIEFRDPETKQVMHTLNLTESIKVDKAIEQVKELVEGGERVVLFSKFKDVLHELDKRLSMENIPSVVLAGGTPEYLKEQIELDFDVRTASKTNPAWQVLLATFDMAGESVNLNAATATIFIDRGWNPAQEDQAAGRTQRFGQTKETTVYILHVLETLDVWMRKIIETKAKMIEGFEDAAELQRLLISVIEEG